MRRPTSTLVIVFCTLALAACGDDEFNEQTTVHTPALACLSASDVAGLPLDEQFCVIAQLDLADRGPISALALDSESLYTYRQIAAEGDETTVFAVERLPLSWNDQTLGSGEDLFRFDLPGSDAFAGFYLARSTGGSIAVGYTLADRSGAIRYGASQTEPSELDAPGNFDTIWWDEDTLLVHGQGLGDLAGDPGVYAWRRGKAPFQLVGGLGTANSYLAAGPDVLYVGESAWPNNTFHALTRDEVDRAIEDEQQLQPSDADLIYDGPATDATALGNDLVVLDISYDEAFSPIFNGVHRIGVSVEQASVTTEGATEVLAAASGEATTTPGQLVSYGDWLAVVYGDAEDQHITVLRLK